MKKNNRPSKKRYNPNLRFTGVLIAFIVLCVFYTIFLAAAQITGERVGEKNYAAERTETVAGLRGEIFDRNGVLLVGNKTSYNLVYEYGAMPETHADINESLLLILDAITLNGSDNQLPEDYFPFEGMYPNYIWTADAKDPGSDAYLYLRNILDNNNLDLKKSTPDELCLKLRSKYKLLESLYSYEEIHRLLRLRYDMERVKFGNYNPYVIAEDVSMQLVSYIEESGAQGVVFDISTERYYAYPGVASHILGRIGKITAENSDYYTALGYPIDAVVGTSGCEAAFEEYLMGRNGKMLIRYDKDGNQISSEYLTEPISGNDVWLTIDIELQIAAEKGLAANVASVTAATAGAVVAINPDNGAVLALASNPTYDLSQFNSKNYYNSLLENGNNPLLNRVTQGIYAPGSLYKIGAALAALESGSYNSSTYLNCNGTFPHEEHKPTCLGKHGSINMMDAIKVSCNVFFYDIGYKLGIEGLTKYTSDLGLGTVTGIELGEATGIVAGPAYRATVNKTWGKGDDLSAAIGQSDHSYTPLQMGVYMATVINGGSKYKAHLLHSVHRFYTGEVIYETVPEVLQTVDFSQNTHNLLKNAMGKVITNSTELITNFSSLTAKNIIIGGKTGTAEVQGKKDYALFTGFAPLDNPEIVAVCIIEQGTVGAYASRTVAEIFKEYFKEK